MEQNELFVGGIGISKNVIAAIVSAAAQKVEGVAAVGVRPIASSLISVFTQRTQSSEPPVESEVVDGSLKVSIHLTVFYGYPFTKLAQTVREAIATTVQEQIGIEISSIDVCIDSIVFPKE